MAKFVEILITFNPAEIAFNKSIHDAYGIDYYFKGEHFQTAGPLSGPARLMIRNDQVEKTRQLIKDVDFSKSK